MDSVSIVLSAAQMGAPVPLDIAQQYHRQVSGLACYSDRRKMVQTAKAFELYGAGWLGVQAAEIKRETVERVVEIARALEGIEGLPNPELTPTETGTISIEWETGEGEAYIEVGATRTSGFVRVMGEPTAYLRDVKTLPSRFFSNLRDVLFPSSQTYTVTFGPDSTSYEAV